MPKSQLNKKLKKTVAYLTSRPWHWYAALGFTLIAGFFRLHKIPQTLMFQGDQGRDALIVADIFREKDLVFIGPVTSVGNMYLGPFYYYLMLPFLWLSYPSPLGPVYAVAIISTLSVFALYLIGKKMFNWQTGLLAAGFFGFSASAMYLARFSWNPNLAPVVSIFMVYFSWKALKKSKYWLLVSLCFSVLIQLHYLTLLTAASAGLLWLYSLTRKIKLKNKKKIYRLAKNTAISIFIFLLSLTPLILFDFKHDGLNRKAFLNLFQNEETFSENEETSLGQTIFTTLKETEGRSMHILYEINFGKNRTLNKWLNVSTLIGLLIICLNLVKNKKDTDAMVTVLAYLLIGILGTATYRHTVFDHYIAYLFPITTLVYGLVLAKIIKFKPGWLVLGAFSCYFLYYNLTHLPLQNSAYLTIKQRSYEITTHLTPADQYDLVLLSPTKDLYGQNYRYFLSTTNNPPLKKTDLSQLNTLIIIDEERKVEDVTSLPIYEIVIFPTKKINAEAHYQTPPDFYILRN